MNILLYTRFATPEISIGALLMGGSQPIIVQSMTNTNTLDVEASIAQCIRVFDAGGHAVRLTAQGVKEAEALSQIREGLCERGYMQPLIADIHFNPKAALIAAQYVEKVRINPGNYVSASRKFLWTDAEYAEELHKIKENLIPLIATCKQYNTAIRVGVNHGSLSQRIISKYGDTPEGMVASMMEFLRIFKDENFYNIVCSVKSSNTRTMVHAYRLLAHTMQQEQCVFPLHLGVTEAGADEDGRIKSAVGIGTLLLDGIGDTIRVSLTEAPEKEIPVCLDILAYRNQIFEQAAQYTAFPNIRASLFGYLRRTSSIVCGIGGEADPVVVAKTAHTNADWYIDNEKLTRADASLSIPIVSCADYSPDNNYPVVLHVRESDFSALQQLRIHEQTIILFTYSGMLFCGQVHALYAVFQEKNITAPVLFDVTYACSFDHMQIHAAMDAGSVFLDGFGNGLCISHASISAHQTVDLSFSILQASRARFTKTEYIACPSCGRTLFNIEEALREVKQKTSHLTGLKIAVMGCVVNGPGEMADADFGYVGAGAGKVHLYKKQTLVQRDVPEKDAVQALLNLIESSIKGMLNAE